MPQDSSDGSHRLSTGALRPRIEPLSWVAAREILPDEAHDFTPWLSQNINLLAETIGLEELTLLETEWSVEGKRLDILASGIDAEGSPVSVVIENQYSRTDNKHLGQLITYVARAAQDQENVIAVWLVETVHPAHLAAVEFLNRTSASGIGYFLVQVKFAPAPNGFHIYFESQARPNEFLKQAQRSSPAREAPPERRDFLSHIFESNREPLLRAGYRHIWIHPKGWIIRAYLPNQLELARLAELRVRATAKQLYVSLYSRSRNSRRVNVAVVEELRKRYSSDLEDKLVKKDQVIWHAREATKSDQVKILWDRGGYDSGEPEQAALWVRQVAETWISLLVNNPIQDLDSVIEMHVADEFEDADDEQGEPE